jgi:hypothetical protein
MVRRDEGGIEDRETVAQWQSLHVLPAVRKNVERVEDDRRVPTGVLEEVEAWLSVLADRHKLAIDRCARVKGLDERGHDERKTLGEVLAVTGEQPYAAFITDRLGAIAVEFQLLCCIRRYVALLFKRG